MQEIAADFDVSRPAISQHLRVLLDAGLLRERRDGRRRIYALNATPLAQVDEWLRSYRAFWERNLQGLKEFVESEGPEAGGVESRAQLRGHRNRRRAKPRGRRHGRRQD